MMHRIDVTHIVLPGGEVKKEEASWTSAERNDAKAIFPEKTLLHLHSIRLQWVEESSLFQIQPEYLWAEN